MKKMENYIVFYHQFEFLLNVFEEIKRLIVSFEVIYNNNNNKYINIYKLFFFFFFTYIDIADVLFGVL